MYDVERLGYHRKWIDYGILNPGAIPLQIAGLAEDPNPEHCRFATAKHFIRLHVQWNDNDLDHLIEVAELDSDRTMSGSIMAELLVHSGLTAAQFDRVCQRSRAWGSWIEKIISRHATLRRARLSSER